MVLCPDGTTDHPCWSIVSQNFSWYVPIANVVAWALGISLLWQITVNGERRRTARIVIVVVVAVTVGIYFFLNNAIPFDEKLRDSLSVWGILLAVLGFAGTWLSLWYAFKQLRRTEESAQLAEQAATLAKKAAEDATTCAPKFCRYTAQHAHHLIREVKTHVGKGEWREVAYRLRDVTEYAIALAQGDGVTNSDWSNFCDELRSWDNSFSIKTPNAQMQASAEQKMDRICASIWRRSWMRKGVG